MRILAVGGGSGGHVTPVLAVVNELATRDKTLDVMFVCDRAFETQARGIMATAAIPVQIRTINAGKLRRYNHLSFFQHFTVRGVVKDNVIDSFKVILGTIQSIWIIARFRPAVVFAKGGYVCLPVGWAAKVLRVPLVIHDSDTKPGLTNRLLARFATAIGTGSPLENYPYDRQRSAFVGVPVKSDFQLVTPDEQSKLKQELGFESSKILLVVTGGGLGAVSINTALTAQAASYEAANINVYHVTGVSHSKAVKQVIGEQPSYKVVPFVYEHMERVFGAADIVVTRASATTLQELAALGKATIAVPAHQLSDQVKNAAVYLEAGAIEVLQDDDITDGVALLRVVTGLAHNTARREQLGQTLHLFARPDAAHDIATMILSAVKAP